MMTKGTSILKERFYPHAIEEVWEAISSQAEISAWFVTADFKPEVGYKYRFTRGGTVITGEVLEVTPPRLLAYTWTVGDPNVITNVKWSLTEESGGTRVRIEHTGIDGYATDAIQATSLGHFTHGWEDCTERLANYLKGR